MNWKQAALLPIGTSVKLRGLESSPQHNGEEGTITSLYDRDTGCCGIKPSGSHRLNVNTATIHVKPQHIIPLSINEACQYWLTKLYENMTNEERINTLLLMDKSCHLCEREVSSMHTSAFLGFTRLICGRCYMDNIQNAEEEK